jgi:transcriptional regulator with GAF, ATPase, and Fis domain
MTNDRTKKLNDKHAAGTATGSSQIELLRVLAKDLARKVENLIVSESDHPTTARSFYEEVQRYEIELIRRALLKTGGNQKQAAKFLGLLPTTLNSKIKRYGIRN